MFMKKIFEASPPTFLCFFDGKNNQENHVNVSFIWGRYGKRKDQGTIGCTPNSVPMVLIGLI